MSSNEIMEKHIQIPNFYLRALNKQENLNEIIQPSDQLLDNLLSGHNDSFVMSQLTFGDKKQQNCHQDIGSNKSKNDFEQGWSSRPVKIDMAYQLGERLASTKSCSVNLNNMFDDFQNKNIELLRPKMTKSSSISNNTNIGQIDQNEPKQYELSEITTFKVPQPRMIPKAKQPDRNNKNSSIFHQGFKGSLSGKYLGILLNKQQSNRIQPSNVLSLEQQSNSDFSSKTPQFLGESNKSSTSTRKFIRGPYKTKRKLKMELKGVEDEERVSKKHSSTLQKEEIARKILHKIEFQTPSCHDQENEIKACNCSNSGCLKLYCECFKNNRYCGGHCRCSCCNNTSNHEEMRLKAKEQILIRNPFAFRSKFAKQIEKQNSENIQCADTLTQQKIVLKQLSDLQPDSKKLDGNGCKSHYKGCNCRKSGCQKKYCECFQQGVLCTDLCKCDGCKNCKPEIDKKLRQPLSPLLQTTDELARKSLKSEKNQSADSGSTEDQSLQSIKNIITDKFSMNNSKPLLVQPDQLFKKVEALNCIMPNQ